MLALFRSSTTKGSRSCRHSRATSPAIHDIVELRDSHVMRDVAVAEQANAAEDRACSGSTARRRARHARCCPRQGRPAEHPQEHDALTADDAGDHHRRRCRDRHGGRRPRCPATHPAADREPRHQHDRAHRRRHHSGRCQPGRAELQPSDCRQRRRVATGEHPADAISPVIVTGGHVQGGVGNWRDGRRGCGLRDDPRLGTSSGSSSIPT